MKTTHKSILGITISRQGLHFTQLKKRSKGHVIERYFAMMFSEKLSLDTPQALAKAIQSGMEKAGFTTNTAILGVPSGWVITKEKQLPASDKREAIEILNLQMFNDFSISSQDLLVDFSGHLNENNKQHLLLVAGQKNKIEKILNLLAKAQLKVIGALPTALGVTQKNDEIILHITDADIELTMYTKHGYAGIEHLSLKPLALCDKGERAWAKQLSDRLKRSRLAFGGGHRRLVIYAAAPLSQIIVDEITKRSGMSIHCSQIAECYRVNDAITGKNLAAYHAAANMGSLAFNPSGLPVNFIDSKLSVKSPSRWAKKKLALFMAAGFGFLILGLVGYAFYSSYRVKQIESDIAASKPLADQAKRLKNKIRMVSPWLDKRSSYINPMHDLSPIIGSSNLFYITSLTISDSHQMLIRGSAKSRTDIPTLTKEIRSSKHFTGATSGPISVNPKTGRHHFEITLIHSGK